MMSRVVTQAGRTDRVPIEASQMMYQLQEEGDLWTSN